MNGEFILKIVSLIVSILGLFGVGTLFTMFWKDRHDKKQAQSAQAQQALKRAKQEEMREVIQQEMVPLNERLSQVEAMLKINCEGTQAGLRNDLLKLYYDCVNKGFKTRYDAENFCDMYVAYTKLGGNSFIHEVSEWFKEVPNKEEFKKNIKGE